MRTVAAIGRSTSPGANARGERVVPAVSTAGIWLEHIALAVVYAVSLASLAGFAVFTRHPQLLNEIPGAAEAYGRMFVLAPRAQIVLAFAALALVLVRRAGARWLPAFAALYALSLASELAGTTVG